MDKSLKNRLLKAVNLGEDTDTTGAIAGGLAGIIYGLESIPQNWKNILVKYNEIEILSELYTKALKQ